MRCTKFIIRNFKGIEEATVDLSPAGANIFTLVGLNESGKTTVLEAISVFGRAESITKILHTTGDIKDDPASFVPKHRKANFSGDTTVEAQVFVEQWEKNAIIKSVEKECKCTIEPNSFIDQPSLKRGYRFLSSDYKSYLNILKIPLRYKKKGGRKYVEADSDDNEWKSFAEAFDKATSKIVYFPTFLFTQPQRIYLYEEEKRKNETSANRLYRQIIENVASSLPDPLNIQEHIVKRVLNEDSLAQKAVSLMLLAPDKQEQITASLNQIQSHLTETVFDRWSKIFGGNLAGREITLKLGIELVESVNAVYIEIYLKDSISTYGISERSLGFRWFFSFVLFTLYRVSAKNAGTTFFLLDEPASNLHARAQMQLLDSLPKLSTDGNQIMFSTHSHYMINPEWLDQSFIVSNSSVDYDDLTDSQPLSRHTNIKVEKYRTFVGKNPNKFTYFQPVLDKLDISPSRLDLLRPSVLVEGKGDYLILQYGLRRCSEDIGKVAIVPTRGATGMNELIGLFLGWAVPFAVCLDDDTEGKAAAQRYKKEWALPQEGVFTLSDISPDLSGRSIEGFLEPSDLEIISLHFKLSSKPTKSQKHLFFSEMLASGKVVNMSTKFEQRIAAFAKRIKNIG